MKKPNRNIIQVSLVIFGIIMSTVQMASALTKEPSVGYAALAIIWAGFAFWNASRITF